MSALITIFSQLLGLLTGFLENRQEIGRAKTVAQIERAKAGATGWTGRIIVIFWFYPALACYIPWLREDAGKGFNLLSAAPEWYLVILGTLTVTVMGIDRWQSLPGKSK